MEDLFFVVEMVTCRCDESLITDSNTYERGYHGDSRSQAGIVLRFGSDMS